MSDVPVPDTTAEEEFDLFDPGPAGLAVGAAQHEANPFAPAQGLQGVQFLVQKPCLVS